MKIFKSSLVSLTNTAFTKIHILISKTNISFILASAALVTSLTTLLIVPNSVFRWWTHIQWQENIKIIRLNTNDYTYIYNGNYDSVFFDRIETKSNDLRKAQYIEIGKVIEGKNYLVFSHKGVNFKDMHRGHVSSILENGVLPEKYEMITVNIDHPLLNVLGASKPTLYTTESKLFFNFGLESKAVVTSSRSFIVMKNEYSEADKKNQ